MNKSYLFRIHVEFLPAQGQNFIPLWQLAANTKKKEKSNLEQRTMSFHSKGNLDISRTGVWLPRNKEKSKRKEGYSWPHFPVLVENRIPAVFLFSLQKRDFVSKGILILSHLPGLLSRIIVCLLPLLCMLETLNLCKHLSYLFLQPLQKK